jgi:hypothetical protein
MCSDKQLGTLNMTENPVTLTKDGGIIMSPPMQDSGSDDSIRIPQVDTSMGADFGAEITDDNRLFAAHREPVAGFLIYGFSADMMEKWFSVNDLATKNADPELDQSLQTELRKLKFKTVLRTFIEFKRLLGNTLLVGFFDDAQKLTDLANEKTLSTSLKHLTVFPKISYSVFLKDENPESFRYGLPLVYQVNNGTQSFRVHWTRCFEHVGVSVLDLIWDDLTCGRNIRWGVGQWVYRVGGGFAVIEYPKEYSPSPGAPLIATTPAKLQEWASSAAFKDITHRKYISIIKETMGFHFEGAQGATLNPEPFFNTNLKQISIATGIPKSILEGAEAGALTGSEKNDQQYYKKISGEQSGLEDVCRWVIDQVLVQINGVPTQEADSAAKVAGLVLRRLLHKVVPAIVKDAAQPLDYEIVWANAFQLSALDEARINLLNEQANQTKLQYRQVDEVREDNDLKPLPLGEGEVVLSLKAPVNPFGSNPNPNPNDPNNPQTPNLNNQDSALPNLRTLLQPILKQVFEGTMNHDTAIQQGTALIQFYNDTEKQRALDYNREKFSKPDIPLSPEQEQEFIDQKTRFTQDFLNLLDKTEKLWKAKQP